jgi:pyridoxine kinase
MILANKDVANKFDGLQIEASLDIIDQTAPKA